MKRRTILPLATTALLACAAAALAATGDYPHWWLARQVVDADAADDFAAANQGQAKWIATCAADEFDAMLVGYGGAGPLLRDVVASLPESYNFTALNLGQLKNLAKPFYDRIQELAAAIPQIVDARPMSDAEVYPWTADRTIDDDDFAQANLGQVKYAFSFDFDRDADGLPDWWEMARFGNLNQDHDDNPDADPMDNLAEYKAGTSPTAPPVDGDHDGLLDSWEMENYGNTSTKDGAAHLPDDALSYAEKYWLGFDLEILSQPAGAGVLSLVVFTPCEN